MTYVCFGIAKLQCQKLNIIGYFFSLLYAQAWYTQKKKKCKEKSKAKRIKMLLNMVASVFLGDVGVMGCTSKVIVPIKQLWLYVSVFDFLISQIFIIWDIDALLLCFTHNTQTFCYFWYMCRYNVSWLSQGIHVLIESSKTCKNTFERLDPQITT